MKITHDARREVNAWMQSFWVKNQRGAFTAVSIDPAHEQNNVSVKGDGGSVGCKP